MPRGPLFRWNLMPFTVSINGTWSRALYHIDSFIDPYPSRLWNSVAAMADHKDTAPPADEAVLGSTAEQNAIPSSQADGAVEKAPPAIADDGKWRNGIKNTLLDCPVEAAWDLVSDWGRWDWYTPPDTIEHTEGEHRKAGCVRMLRYPTMWVKERALVIDNEKRFLSYGIEENDALGGIKGFVAWTELQATSDGKTLIPYWDYEVEPLENFTPETFQTVLEAIFKPVFDDLEKGAQSLAAGHAVDPTTTETLKQ